MGEHATASEMHQRGELRDLTMLDDLTIFVELHDSTILDGLTIRAARREVPPGGGAAEPALPPQHHPLHRRQPAGERISMGRLTGVKQV